MDSMISDKAVEAARAVWGPNPPSGWRAALAAAAPHLQAEAWDEGWQKAHACDDPAMAGIFFNPYRSQG